MQENVITIDTKELIHMNPEDDKSKPAHDEGGFPLEQVKQIQSIVPAAQAVSEKYFISPAANAASAGKIKLIARLKQIESKAVADVQNVIWPLGMTRLNSATGRSRARKNKQDNVATKLLVAAGPRLQAVNYAVGGQ